MVAAVEIEEKNRGAMKKLKHAPITEAVVDIDCAMPPTFNVAKFEESNEFRSGYPISRKRFLDQQHIIQQDSPAYHDPKRVVHALLFATADEKQLIQARTLGYSFNRLAPYSSFDEYLPEIERTWKIFVKLAEPVQVAGIRVRYLNRILVPLPESHAIELEDYFRNFPHLPANNLVRTGFLHQDSAMETGTDNFINLILTGHGTEGNKAPIILDITAGCPGPAEPSNWEWILSRLHLLRSLKNKVFENTLTEKCLNLFQQP